MLMNWITLNQAARISIGLLLGGMALSCSKQDPAPAQIGQRPVGPSTAAPAVPPPAAPEPAAKTLRPRWPAGQRLTYQMDVEHSMDLPVPGMEAAMQQGTLLSQTFALTPLRELAEGGHELELEFVAMQLESRMGDQVVLAFDSREDRAADGDNPLAGALRQVIGSKVRLALDAKNKVASTEGAQGLLQRLMRGAATQVRSLLQSSLSEDDFHRVFEFYKILPEGAVEPGAEWTSRIAMSVIPVGTLHSPAVARFSVLETRENRECAKLDFAGPLQSEGRSASGLFGAMTIGEGAMTGATWFDPKDGVLVASTNRCEVGASMELPRALGGGGGLSLTLRQDTRLRLIEISAAHP